jgi:type I restriction enzyme S subunit
VLDNFFVPPALSALVNSTDKERAGCSIERGDVFLTRTSETQEELGMSCVALKDYAHATFNGFTKRLRPKSGVTIVPEYAGYYFRGPRFRQAVTAMSSLSTRASLNNEMLSRLSIVLPPLSVQASIGRILKSLDDKIELNRRINATLEGISRAIFKSWFVDFDPVRQKAAGKQPVGMDAKTAALFPDSFEDSEIGEVPKGWATTPFSDLLTPRNERAGDLVLTEYSSTNEGLFPRSDRFKKQLAVSTSKNKVIRQGDLVFGLSREVLNFGLMRDEIGSVSGAYKVFAVNADVFASDLLEQTMRSRPQYYYGAVSASSREGQSVSADSLLRLLVAVPPVCVQNAFYSIAKQLTEAMDSLAAQSRTLAALRDTLLPKLLSGEVRVPEAERAVEEVLG